MIVIDIEASALLDGYPIELGWARPDGECRAYLIKPTEKLTDLRKWDPFAQNIHGLSRELLDQRGMPIDEVVENLNRDLAGEDAYSDAPSHVWHWLEVLLESSDIDKFSFEMVGKQIDPIFIDYAASAGAEELAIDRLLRQQRRMRAHTAAIDAASWAAAIEAIPAAARGDVATFSRIFKSWRSRAIAVAPWRESSDG